MKRIVVLAVLGFSVPAAAQDKKDEESIRALFAQTDAAFAKKDVKTLAAMFTDDAISMRADGRVLKGKKEIEASLSADLAAGRLGAKSKNTPTFIRWIDKQHALVDVDMEFSVPDTPVMRFHSINLLVRNGNKWLVKDARGWAFLPPRAPPK